MVEVASHNLGALVEERLDRGLAGVADEGADRPAGRAEMAHRGAALLSGCAEDQDTLLLV